MPLWWRPACACNDGGPSEYCLVTGPSPVPDYNMIPAKTGDSFIYPDSATAGIISGKLAVDWREAFQTHLVPSWYLVCSTIYIIRVYISTYLQSEDIYTYLQAVDISTMECVRNYPWERWLGCSWRGHQVSNCPPCFSRCPALVSAGMA